jgi:hypothetical protein
VPQNDEPGSIDSADVKRTEVVFPQGLELNPAAAQGLEGCSEVQMGYMGTGTDEPVPVHFNTKPVGCPDGSKIASVDLETPLLDGVFHGALYQAAQGANPFGSLLATYLVVRERGVTIKLAGQVRLDPATGQVTAVFDHTPQLPFSHLRLSFDGGPRAIFRLPTDCGT